MRDQKHSSSPAGAPLLDPLLDQLQRPDQSPGDDATGLMDFLRRKTYELSPTPLANLDHGFEFMEQYR